MEHFCDYDCLHIIVNIFYTSWKITTNTKLREKCSYSEFFWSVYSRIRTECGETRSTSPYSVGMRERTEQKNSEYGYFSRSVTLSITWVTYLFVQIQILNKKLKLIGRKNQEVIFKKLLVHENLWSSGS